MSAPPNSDWELARLGAAGLEAELEAEDEREAIQRAEADQERQTPPDELLEQDARRSVQRQTSRAGAPANGHAPVVAPADTDTGPRLAGIDFADMRPHLADGYVVKGFLTPRSLAAIIGGTGSGKTFFATDLAVHIAAKRPWRGRRVRGGLVVYVALEGPVSAENRFCAAREHLNPPKALPLRLTPGPLNLRDPADVASLIAFVRESEKLLGAKVVAIFVDTLSRALAGGDENASEDMGALIAGADVVRLATGATVILVHHLGKDDTRGARGHSSLKCALDTEIEVAERPEAHVATVTKQRDLIRGEQFAFRLRQVELGRDEDGDPVTTCTVEPLDQAPQAARAQPAGQNQRKLLAALQEWQRQHPDDSDGAVLSGIDLRSIAKTQGITKKSALDSTLSSLERTGWLTPCAGGFRFRAEDAL